jgi:hypothetical protein
MAFEWNPSARVVFSVCLLKSIERHGRGAVWELSAKHPETVVIADT